MNRIRFLIQTFVIGLVGLTLMSFGKAPAPQALNPVIAKGTAKIVQEQGLPGDPLKITADLEIFQNANQDIISAKTGRGSVVVVRNKSKGTSEYWHTGTNVINGKYVTSGMATEYHVMLPLYSAQAYADMYAENENAIVSSLNDGIEVTFGVPGQASSVITPQTIFHLAGKNVVTHFRANWFRTRFIRLYSPEE